jgi:16S rRNA (guanine966-N2)-methyltransferase
MGDREKTALFNSILMHLPGAIILDAFAGSGALGLEALSRGAKHTTFVDKDKSAAKTITQNIQLLKLNTESKLYPTSISKFLAINTNNFDIIFADPPYDQINYGLISALVSVLSPSGILVLSHPANDEPPTFPSVILSSSKTYAGARISIYTRS